MFCPPHPPPKRKEMRHALNFLGSGVGGQPGGAQCGTSGLCALLFSGGGVTANKGRLLTNPPTPTPCATTGRWRLFSLQMSHSPDWSYKLWQNKGGHTTLPSCTRVCAKDSVRSHSLPISKNVFGPLLFKHRVKATRLV